MSRSQFQSKRFILRHAWLNLWDERMTTGRINQVAILNCSPDRQKPLLHQAEATLDCQIANETDLPFGFQPIINIQQVELYFRGPQDPTPHCQPHKVTIVLRLSPLKCCNAVQMRAELDICLSENHPKEGVSLRRAVQVAVTQTSSYLPLCSAKQQTTINKSGQRPCFWLENAPSGPENPNWQSSDPQRSFPGRIPTTAVPGWKSVHRIHLDVPNHAPRQPKLAASITFQLPAGQSTQFRAPRATPKNS